MSVTDTVTLTPPVQFPKLPLGEVPLTVAEDPEGLILSQLGPDTIANV